MLPTRAVSESYPCCEECVRWSASINVRLVALARAGATPKKPARVDGVQVAV